MDNNQLIQTVIAARNGSNDAINTLYNEFKDTVYYTAYKMTGDPDLASDVTQDVFVELIKSISTLREPMAFVNWLKRITANQCVRYARKWREQPADENEDGTSILDIQAEEKEDFLPEAALAREDLRKTIMAMIDQLPDVQRMAVIMHYYQNLPIKEIAQIQNLGENTIKSRLFKARKAIRELVEDYEKKNEIKLYSENYNGPVKPILPWAFDGEDRTMPPQEAAKVAQGISDATAKPVTVAQDKPSQKTEGSDIWRKAVITILAIALLIGCVALLIFALSGGKDEPAPTEPAQTEAPETTQAAEETAPEYYAIRKNLEMNENSLTSMAVRNLLWPEPVVVDNAAEMTAEDALRLTAPMWIYWGNDKDTDPDVLAIDKTLFDELCQFLFGKTYDVTAMSGTYGVYDQNTDAVRLVVSENNWRTTGGYRQYATYQDADGSQNFVLMVYENMDDESSLSGTYTVTMEPNATGWQLRSIQSGDHHKGVQVVEPTAGNWDFTPSGEGQLRTDGIYYAKTTDMDGNEVYRYIRVLEGNDIISTTSVELNMPGPDWDADDVNWLDFNSNVDQGSLMWWGLGENKILKGSLLLKSGGHYFMQVEPCADGMLVHYTYDWSTQDSPDKVLGYRFVPFA